MNQVADENELNVMCSKKSTNSKNKNNKKAKDLSDTSEDMSILEQTKLTEALANTLHINNINNSLTNGSNDHASDDSPINSCPVGQSEAQEKESCEVANCVNSVQCSDTARNCESTTTTSPGAQLSHDCGAISNNLENSLDTQEQSPQDDIDIISYESELQMPEIMRLIQKDLSEPYSIYTYRYFIHNWPKLCFLASHKGKCIGAIVCKLDMHRQVVKRGYIAMLAVDEKYRKRKIGSRLVRKAIQVMSYLTSVSLPQYKI